jgi:SPP1 gp7 family putative phage head morphogenesis protein
MPFRKGTYNNYDDYTRKQLEQALEQSGGAPWVVIPKDGNIEYIENHANGDGRLYKLLRDACNEEILIGILGQTMTTVSGSSRAQSQTHKEVEISVNKNDRRFIQRILNQKFLPILEARGYPVKDGKFDFPEAESDLTLIQRFDIDSQLNELIDIDEDYFYETYGVPKPTGNLAKRNPLKPLNTGVPGEITVPVKPPGDKTKARSKFKSLRDLFSFFQKTPTVGLSNPRSGGIKYPQNILAPSLDTNKIIERIAQQIYSGKFPESQTDPELHQMIGDLLMQGLKDNVKDFDQVTVDQEQLTRWINMQQNNIYKFAMAKSFDEMKAMRDRVIDPDSGKIKPYTEYQQEVTAIDEDYNRNWMATEYDAVVRGTVMGMKWQDIEETKEEKPFLEYVTAGDDRVREEHEELEGTIEPVDSPFWEEFYPPNGWNCRCSVSEL